MLLHVGGVSVNAFPPGQLTNTAKQKLMEPNQLHQLVPHGRGEELIFARARS